MPALVARLRASVRRLCSRSKRSDDLFTVVGGRAMVPLGDYGALVKENQRLRDALAEQAKGLTC